MCKTFLGLQASIAEASWYNPLRRDPAFKTPCLPGSDLEGKQKQSPERFKGSRTEGTWPCLPGETGSWESFKKPRPRPEGSRGSGQNEASRQMCG